MDLNSPCELYFHELVLLYSAEQQLTRWLPSWVDRSFAPQLANLFTRQLIGQIERIERLAAIMAETITDVDGTHNAIAQLILEGGITTMYPTAEPAPSDAALIATARRMIHLEMAGYQNARAFATLCGHDDAADMLCESFDELIGIDARLAQLMQSLVHGQLIDADDLAYRA